MVKLLLKNHLTDRLHLSLQICKLLGANKYLGLLVVTRIGVTSFFLNRFYLKQIPFSALLLFFSHQKEREYYENIVSILFFFLFFFFCVLSVNSVGNKLLAQVAQTLLFVKYLLCSSYSFHKVFVFLRLLPETVFVYTVKRVPVRLKQASLRCVHISSLYQCMVQFYVLPCPPPPICNFFRT